MQEQDDLYTQYFNEAQTILKQSEEYFEAKKKRRRIIFVLCVILGFVTLITTILYSIR